MRRNRSGVRESFLALAIVCVSTNVAHAETDPLLDVLQSEAKRTTDALKNTKSDDPLYYLSYRVRDGVSANISASYGALTGGVEGDVPNQGRSRVLAISARVGSPKFDNTHRSARFGGGGAGQTYLPIEDDDAALRLAVWKATENAYKAARNQIIMARTSKAIKVKEEDAADDFATSTAQVHVEPISTCTLDKKGWSDRLRRLSALFKDHPWILDSSVSLEGGCWTDYFVDSDGARIRRPTNFLRVMVTGSVRADDGMNLPLHRDFSASSAAGLPDEATLKKAITELIGQLEALRVAPVVDPYSGPAVLTNRAAAVYFHEIFGHRIEGHRQKDVDEGHTFTKRVGKAVMPDFISVTDDPTREKFGDLTLNGHYTFDDEGVPAQAVTLVDKGVLKSFLMCRSPIKDFPASNGHGRSQAGLAPVARQGNLIVSASKRVPAATLRKMLLDEVKKQGKPFGLMFDEISGGFTQTRTGPIPQAFTVQPLIVVRVFADGRPDELVRGVNVIGTPLQSLEKIIAAGDDDAVFNGYCGAESGWVPVSAVAPSLLLGSLEVERSMSQHERPPLQPPPLHPDAPWTKPDLESPGTGAGEGGAP